MLLAFIQANEVSFGYDEDSPVISGLNLSIGQSGFSAVMGPNGSGKTTMGKLMMGILKPRSGSIFIDGKDITSMSLGDIGEKIGYLFQNPEFQIFSHTLLDELTFIPMLKGRDKEAINTKAEKVLKLLHLEDKKDVPTFYLSYGEKQRLAIAGILMGDPGYLILDEPTNGLDMVRKDILLSILKELLDRGIGMTVITHDSKFINNFSGKLFNIENGEVIEGDI